MNEKDTYELLAKGRGLLDTGHNHQAAIVLEKACELEPSKGSVREAYARALFNSGQTARAGKQFEKAVELDPADDYAHFGLALCKARLGERTKAIGLLKIALAMRPNSANYQDHLARLAG